KPSVERGTDLGKGVAPLAGVRASFVFTGHLQALERLAPRSAQRRDCVISTSQSQPTSTD
ncbi:MAG: hypothetical protein KAZ88_13250, partial [Acidimicrobiia bacterium]|nr:hypothetical protein [Acidimicrobiia bacterium]